ncbi:uncharacterized protein LOC124808671 [Hydra vulgaris]|uniref:uncharacterized protein LOC124808671 n=1 Tax=Hydra vulgaris TaxID=6087 RepID=UPI001F5FEEDB|nr:uncharacterized protein LOC124808671 [Hydra vulgaris]
MENCIPGFVEKKACVTNLLETMDFLTANMARKLPVDVVFLDFAKALDKVQHQRLLYKLKMYGIKENFLNWIKAFLTNRSQRVILGNTQSNWLPVSSGVPVVNTLAAQLQLQSDIDEIVLWSKSWLMELNVKKCKVMQLSQKNSIPFEYSMEETGSNSIVTQTNLEKTTSERDLGIQITNDLKVESQSIIASCKANQMPGILKHTFECRDASLWKQLYSTYVRPLLEIAISAWNPHLVKDEQVIEKIQHRATKRTN